MPHVAVPEEKFHRLVAKAAALNISVDDFVQPTLEQLAESETALPLTGDSWQAELNAWKRDAESRAGRFSSNFVLDDRRETVYREREDAQR